MFHNFSNFLNALYYNYDFGLRALLVEHAVVVRSIFLFYTLNRVYYVCLEVCKSQKKTAKTKYQMYINMICMTSWVDCPSVYKKPSKNRRYREMFFIWPAIFKNFAMLYCLRWWNLWYFFFNNYQLLNAFSSVNAHCFYLLF